MDVSSNACSPTHACAGAVQEMLNHSTRKSDEFFVMEAATTTQLAQPWTTDRKLAINAIRRIKTRTQFGSFLRNSVMSALDVLKTGMHKKQVLVIVTDGDPPGRRRQHGNVDGRSYRRACLGCHRLCAGARPGGCRRRQQHRRQQPGASVGLEWARITDATSGRTHYTQGYQQTEEAIDQLGKEFTQQSEIAYARGAADDRYHQIVVGVRRKDVTIRHRRGYLAQAPAAPRPGTGSRIRRGERRRTRQPARGRARSCAPAGPTRRARTPCRARRA